MFCYAATWASYCDKNCKTFKKTDTNPDTHTRTQAQTKIVKKTTTSARQHQQYEEEEEKEEEEEDPNQRPPSLWMAWSASAERTISKRHGLQQLRMCVHFDRMSKISFF